MYHTILHITTVKISCLGHMQCENVFWSCKTKLFFLSPASTIATPARTTSAWCGCGRGRAWTLTPPPPSTMSSCRRGPLRRETTSRWSGGGWRRWGQSGHWRHVFWHKYNCAYFRGTLLWRTTSCVTGPRPSTRCVRIAHILTKNWAGKWYKYMI